MFVVSVISLPQIEASRVLWNNEKEPLSQMWFCERVQVLNNEKPSHSLPLTKGPDLQGV